MYGHKCFFQIDNDPKHIFKVVGKWLMYNTQGSEVSISRKSQVPELNPIENLCWEIKKYVKERRPTDLIQFQQQHFTQVKQWQGKANKY